MPLIDDLVKKYEFKGHDFGPCFSSFISRGSNPNLINIADLRWISCKTIRYTEIKNKSQLINNGVPIFDYMLVSELIAEKKLQKEEVEFKEDANVPETCENLTEVEQSLLYIYINIMTRGKPLIGTNEVRPKLLSEFFQITMDEGRIEKTLSMNKFGKISHEWVQFVKYESLGRALQARLKLGMCGNRYFSVFTKYDCKKDVAQNFRIAFNAVKDVAEKGPYLDLHPLFNYTGVSYVKNVKNLILECFSDEDIARMKKNKEIFSVLKKDDSVRDYLQWTSNSFVTLRVTVESIGSIILDRPMSEIPKVIGGNENPSGESSS